MRMKNEVDRLQRPVEAADEPPAGLWFEPELLHQDAFWHDASIVAVESEFSIGFAIQVLGLVYATVCIHKDRRMPECADRKNRNCYKGRFSVFEGPKKVGKAQFRNIESVLGNHAPKDLGHIRSAVVLCIHSFYAHIPVTQGAGAIIVPDIDIKFYVCHE